MPIASGTMLKNCDYKDMKIHASRLLEPNARSPCGRVEKRKGERGKFGSKVLLEEGNLKGYRGTGDRRHWYGDNTLPLHEQTCTSIRGR